MATTEQRNEIIKNQIALRKHLWPDIQEAQLWHRKKSDGYTTIPRLLPLILQMMDDMSKNKPISSTYLELWCRTYDLSIVTLAKQDELAFHAGFAGQRKISTWKERLKILQNLGFIDIQSGPSGPMSYALIWNPYHVIKKLYENKHPGISTEAYNALYARALEIKAKDLM